MFYKRGIPLLVLFSLHGCFSSHYYILSTPSTPKHTYNRYKMRIGVEKVTLPKYLFKHEIAVAASSHEVVFVSDGTWAEDLDEGLTLRIIGFLRKKFNQPNIHAYPWGADKQPHKKIHIAISRFIAQDHTVYLDAAWEIKNIQTGQRTSRLFSTEIPTDMHTPNIIDAMNQAFSQLEENIAKGLLHKN